MNQKSGKLERDKIGLISNSNGELSLDKKTFFNHPDVIDELKKIQNLPVLK